MIWAEVVLKHLELVKLPLSVIHLFVGWELHSELSQFSSMPWLFLSFESSRLPFLIRVFSQSARGVRRAYLVPQFSHFQALPFRSS